MTARTQQPRLPDAVSWLSLYVFILFAIPSRLIFAPLGGAGAPSQMLGLVSLAWWAWYHLSRWRRSEARFQPVRAALGVFVAAVGISYVVAMLRPIESDEVSTADLSLLAILAWSGTLLLANDGIPSRERLDILVGRLAIAGGAVAVLGIAQFVTGESFVDAVTVPGLTASSVIGESFGRGEFTRPSGTAVHPIEYGVVVTMLLPFALHWAVHGRTSGRVLRWLPIAAIALVIPLSLSRSAIVGTALCLLVLVPTWPRAHRRIAMAAVGGLAVVIFIAVPGFLGTLTGLFTGIGTDSSAQSRTGSYAIAAEFIQRAPLFGRGLGTFLPRYRILDNQLLLLLVEIGVFGLVAFLGVVATAVTVMVRLRRSTPTDERTRDLAQSMIASIVAGTCSLALFDAFSFPMAAGTLFLVFGLAGALNRTSQPPEAAVSRKVSALRG